MTEDFRCKDCEFYKEDWRRKKPYICIVVEGDLLYLISPHEKPCGLFEPKEKEG